MPIAADAGVDSLAGEDAVPTDYPASSVGREIDQMHAAVGGDPHAMRSIYEREAPRLLARLRYLCGDPALAQDLLQECFLRAFAGEARFSGASAAGPWLHGVAVNLWRNKARKQQRRRGLLGRSGGLLEPRTLPGPSEVQAHDELEARLDLALARLRAPLREAFVLRVVEELPLAEAAALAGVSKATLSRRAREAQHQLREQFAEESER